VNILVTEPMRKSVAGVTGAPVSMLATPKPFANTSRSSLTTATAAPGVLLFLSSSSATFSSLAKSTFCWRANNREAGGNGAKSNTNDREKKKGLTRNISTKGFPHFLVSKAEKAKK
jgi:hypothetical protein